MPSTPANPVTSAIAALLCICAAPAIAQVTIASDSFELADHPTGNRVTTGATSGITFFTRNAPSANYDVTIGNDAVFGSNVLRQIDNSGAAGNQVIGILPLPIVLANVDDFVTLAFKFRILNIGTVTPNQAGFRFGIWGDNGTPVTGDGQGAVSDNDLGYYVQTGIGTGTPGSSNLLYNENGLLSPIGGGTDRFNVAASGAGVAINDSNIHQVEFTLTRSSSTAMALSVTFDGATTFTGTASTNLRTSFSEIAFTTGFVTNATHFALDDIQVTSSVPEPGSAVFGALGLASLAAARRRKAK